MDNKIFSRLKWVFSKDSKLLYDFGWMSLERLIRLLLTLFTTVLIARQLGPIRYGNFSFIISIYVIFNALSFLGLENVVIKELVTNKTEKKQIIGSSLFIKFILSLFIFLILICYTLIFFDEQIILPSIIVFISIIINSLDIIDFSFQSERKFNKLAVIKLLSFLIYSIFCFLAVKLDLNLFYFSLIFLLEHVIRALFLTVVCLKAQECLSSIKINIRIIRHLIIKSWPLFLSTITVIIYMKVDILMIKSLSEPEVLGHYSASARLSEIFYNIPVIVATILFPKLISQYKQDSKSLEKEISKIYAFITPLMVLISLIIMIFSFHLINVLFGQGYEKSTDILKIHIWSLMFISFSVIRGKWLIIKDLSKYAFYSQFIGACTNVVLNFILIPKLGGRGAAISTLVLYFLASTGSSFLFKKLRVDFYNQIKSFVPIIHLPFLIKNENQ